MLENIKVGDVVQLKSDRKGIPNNYFYNIIEIYNNNKFVKVLGRGKEGNIVEYNFPIEIIVKV